MYVYPLFDRVLFFFFAPELPLNEVVLSLTPAIGGMLLNSNMMLALCQVQHAV